MSDQVMPAVLTYAEAARYLGLPSVDALRMMVYRGSAPPSLSYGKRDRRFRLLDLDRWLARKAEEAAARATPQSSALLPRRRGRPTKAEAVGRRIQGLSA